MYQVYKLTSKNTNWFYIGRTKQSLHQRLTEHKREYRNFLQHRNCRCGSFLVISAGDCTIELIQDFNGTYGDSRNVEYDFIRSHNDSENLANIDGNRRQQLIRKYIDDLRLLEKS